MTVNAITDTKKRRTGIAPTYLYTTLNIKYKIEINMHHRSKAMQPAGPLSDFDEILCR